MQSLVSTLSKLTEQGRNGTIFVNIWRSEGRSRSRQQQQDKIDNYDRVCNKIKKLMSAQSKNWESCDHVLFTCQQDIDEAAFMGLNTRTFRLLLYR
jgi:hypothetical protein